MYVFDIKGIFLFSAHPHADRSDPQNSAGVSQEKSVPVMSQTIVVSGDQ